MIERERLQEPKKKRKLLFPVASIIVLLAATGFMVSRAGIDKALAKQQLDRFIAQTKEKALERGREIDITYGRLEVIGSFASRHVVIRNPVLLIRLPDKHGVGSKDGLRVSTLALEIYPRAKDFSSLRIQASEPIDFSNESEPNKSLLKVKSNAPMAFVVTKHSIESIPYTDIAFESPNEIDFTYLREQQATGQEDATPKIVPVYQNLHLSTAQGSGFTSNLSDDGNVLGEAKVDFRNLIITPDAAPQSALRIAELTGHWSNRLNEKKMNVINNRLKFGPVTSDDVTLPYLPIELDLDASYEGAFLKTAEAVATIQSQDSLILLKDFSLSSKDVGLKAVANFTASTADILPVGNATISVTNLPIVLDEFRKYGMLNEKNEPLITALLQHIIGTTSETWSNVTIPIERARGGAFKIGKATFEELFALLLKGTIQEKPSDSAPASQNSKDGHSFVPQLPSSDKPKLAPIEVPDPSARG